MNMMGKRVNHSGRSVISPDLYLKSNEVGVPQFIAQNLSYNERVTESNFKEMQKLVQNGVLYPGADKIKIGERTINLKYLNQEQRNQISQSIPIGSIVYRHMQDGDQLIFNRQPTLHKPSFMSHNAKIMQKNQTLVQNYANCKSYNADFDGDEMNIHFLQNYMAKAEAKYILQNDRQYIKSSDGKPIRELMQDSIIGGLFLTFKDRFFNKQDFYQMLYQCLGNKYDIKLVQPAIIKPEFYTGKQLISNILKIIGSWDYGMYMNKNTKFDDLDDENQLIVINNELIKGVIDKNQIGSGAEFGLFHSFYELFGSEKLGELMNAFCRLFQNFLQIKGFSQGIKDIYVNQKQRNEKIENFFNDILQLEIEFINKKIKESQFKDLKQIEKTQNNFNLNQRNQNQNYLQLENKISKAIQHLISLDPNFQDELDIFMSDNLSKYAKTIIKDSLDNLVCQFPYNNWIVMTKSGAKGAQQNHIQVSAFLGQQALEGKRVPLMINGKTLPCFIPYDPNPRSGGFVSDRFLTGLRIQEFYFHTMAGREGLLDTTIKTSRSGYLQRCLIKHLEGLYVAYDNTVRDSDNSIVQFLYGEDSINTEKTNYLNQFNYLKQNQDIYNQKLQIKNVKQLINSNKVQEFLKTQSPKYLLQNFNPQSELGAISYSLFQKFTEFYENEKDRKMVKKLQDILFVKYIQSMVEPGENVGCIAGQAVGEPSTQMTLNTFHNAGHGAVNLTLGVPRLRELLITASSHIKTPIMNIIFENNKALLKAYKKLKTISLQEYVEDIEILSSQNSNHFEYQIIIQLSQTSKKIQSIFENQLKLKLNNEILKFNNVKQEKKGNITSATTEVENKNKTGSEQIQCDNIDDGFKFIFKFKSQKLKYLLLMNSLQKILKNTVSQQTKNIKNSVILSEIELQTNGVNFKALFKLNGIVKFTSNDVAQIEKQFGIEAARNLIIKEVQNVFKVYGVFVNFRHLSLIADFMCFPGFVKPMNRQGMDMNISPVQQMSYEQCTQYLTQNAIYSKIDWLQNPSSQILVGAVTKFGTGLSQILMEF